ncbi:GntR family transcriptional regulator [Ancylobacter sp. MQZ15Z-1]|uniref:GntR family transcriptional regulator n=1 Tax=Ancylobacter mangrovi TaxID=2972472 RepID=A0A9X2PJU6_9HYPH|nr:GntR family transcriptional regulator [Ancylobacter mangrovi]MCS0496532.1 GntR family transcriptional regulator [Ancylobacter mangrovi]
MDPRKPVPAASPSAPQVPLGTFVYRFVLDALRNGELKPGERVREQDIAERLGVSRTPVREALGRLVEKRLLEPVGGRGLVVRSLSATEIVDLYVMREIIEGAAARLAAQHASAPELAAMEDLLARFAAHPQDDERELARLNRLFHDAIHRAARNPYLDSASSELHDAIALLGSTTFAVPGRAREATGEHAAILQAIAARDADRAEQAARAHIRDAFRARLGLIGGA